MTTPATSVEDQSLFDAIAGLLPAELREHFYRRMAHLRNLTPNDELLQIAEAMGFLAIVTRQAPAEIATERAKLETLFQEATPRRHCGRAQSSKRCCSSLRDAPATISRNRHPGCVRNPLHTESDSSQNDDRIQQPTRDVLRSRARDVEAGECSLDLHAGRFEQRCEPCPGPQPCAG